ncbi:ABC transporter permease subunit [Clostridium oceanicum]|uniref:ABC-2 family transporter protein n=1 Tax=Clostridium oceanicum TaxID=1543 RepID=A0ABN1JM76_9CLOT
MDVFFQELKRQFRFKRLLIYVLISIVLALLWAWFIVGGATEDFMQSECYKEYKGRAAIEIAAKDRNVTAGKMTEDKFQKGCDAFFHALRSDDESDVVITKDLLQYAVYADRLIMQQFSLRKMMGKSTKGVSYIPKDAGKYFYKNEDLYYGNYIDNNAHNQSEKKLAISTWNKVKKPYIYYSGFKQWDEGIGHIMFLSFVFMIMIGVFAGSIIAKDKEDGIDEIIKATRNGRKSLILPKIIIPWIVAFIIYFCGVGLYIVLLKYLLPTNALNTSVQVLGISILPLNLEDLLKKLFLFGGIGVLTIASFSTWISSLAKKASQAIQMSILTILVSFMLFTFMDIKVPIIDVIKMFLPGAITFSYQQFMEQGIFPITTMLGKVFWIPSILLVVSGIIFLLSTVFTALNYRRR